MSVLYNENDAYPAQWMRNLVAAGHIAHGTVDERSIADLGAEDLAGVSQFHAFAGIGVWSHALRSAGWPDDDPVWTGSCPCQPFSAAGKRGGHTDQRHLWPEWFHLIRQCHPPVIFGEQVASRDGLAWLDAVQSDLEGEGYAFGALDLCAAGVGAPHIRQRVYFVAHSFGGGNGDAGRGTSGGTESGVQGAPRERERLRPDAGERRADGIVGHADEPRWTIRAGLAGDDGAPAESPTGKTTIEDGAGFWSDARWIACRDGKCRPTGPGVFPLAHGVAQRVGRLRAYGNAIVAPLAAEFVRAYMESAHKPGRE